MMDSTTPPKGPHDRQWCLLVTAAHPSNAEAKAAQWHTSWPKRSEIPSCQIAAMAVEE